MQVLPPALAALGRWPQFVCWIAVPKGDGSPKMEKLPVAWSALAGKAAGEVVTAHDPVFWTTFDVAAAMAPMYDRGYGSGVGFVLTDQDPFFCLDIDGALQPDGTWSALAIDLCKTFGGAGVEVSQSGRGLHIFGCATHVPHAKKNTALGLELYTEKRFIALTGNGASGDCWTDHSQAFASVVAGLFDPSKNAEFDDWTDEPCAGWGGPDNDEAMLARCMRHNPKVTADQAFGSALKPVTFAQLFNADADALGAYWPHETKAYDESSADVQLANLLAFFTGKNCAQMERLMLRSALVRAKWEERPEYLQTTILQACRFVKTVLNEGDAPPPVVVASAKPGSRRPQAKARETYEYMSAQDQIAHFDGCVYVIENETVYSAKHGKEYKRGAFNAVYGGFFFVTDLMGKKSTESAYDAFVNSKVIDHEKVDDLCFRPTEESGAIIDEGNYRYVNSYVPHEPRRVQGDATPFLDLLARILPDERDRAILLNYMACVVQFPGRKLQWWPVIQGAEGNGKSFLLNCITYALGAHHCHLPNVAALARSGMQFNDWVHRKLFIGMEEVYVPDRRGFLEEFKTTVTNKRLGMEVKGGKQSTKDNCANGMMLTNHPDGVPVNADTRRYAIFYTAQQFAEDLIRDGMDGDYFSRFWAWAEGDGFAIVADYLLDFPIQHELSPLGAFSSRAPKTSSSDRANTESRGRIEQEIVEAISGGRPGFCGGWISSRMLDGLLDHLRTVLPRNKRNEVMKRLNYIPHPAFPDGRAHRNLKPDGYRSTLWAKEGSLALNFTDPDAAANAYERAQQVTSTDIQPMEYTAR